MTIETNPNRYEKEFRDVLFLILNIPALLLRLKQTGLGLDDHDADVVQHSLIRAFISALRAMWEVYRATDPTKANLRAAAERYIVESQEAVGDPAKTFEELISQLNSFAKILVTENGLTPKPGKEEAYDFLSRLVHPDDELWFRYSDIDWHHAMAVMSDTVRSYFPSHPVYADDFKKLSMNYSTRK